MTLHLMELNKIGKDETTSNSDDLIGHLEKCFMKLSLDIKFGKINILGLVQCTIHDHCDSS